MRLLIYGWFFLLSASIWGGSMCFAQQGDKPVQSAKASIDLAITIAGERSNRGARVLISRHSKGLMQHRW